MSHIIARSTNITSNTIRDDLLISFHQLENCTHKLKAMKNESTYSLDELSKITQLTLNAINVYCQNSDYILKAAENFYNNKTIAGHPMPNLLNFETYQADNPGATREEYANNDEYIKKEARVWRENTDNAKELYQLANLCTFFETLKLKIVVTTEKLEKSIKKLKEPGPLTLTFSKLGDRIETINTAALKEFALSPQELRSANPTKPQVNLRNSQQTIVVSQQAPATSHPSPKVELDSYPETVEVSPQQTPPAPSSATVTINFNVGFGKTLGICCEPNWEKQPLVLSNMGNDWSGEVPVDKNWKFVILKNGQIVKWETIEHGKNRLCEAGKDSSACNYTGQVKFS